MPESIPQTPPKPEAKEYPISALHMLPRFTRQSYYDRYKEQAPPFDPKRPPQLWFDSTANATEDYDYDEFAGDLGIVDSIIPGQWAAGPNLPGPYTYPEYRVRPTPAMEFLPEIGRQGVSPWRLSTREQAEALATQIEATLIRENPIHTGGIYSIDWHGEERRIWQVIWKGSPLNVGLMLRRQHREGVGAPGHWDTSNPSLLRWVIDVQETGEDSVEPEVPIPVRQLHDDEQIVKVHFFGVDKYMVARPGSELLRPVEGGLNREQDERLKRIERGIEELLAQ